MTTTWPQDRPDYASLEAALQGEAARWNIPGAASAILQDGRIEVATAGFANLATKEPVRPETLFQIGSITKIYTATLVQILCEEGVFALDDPVVRYLPDFTLQDTAAAKRVTIRHCISHQGGFEGDIFDDQGLGDDALEKSIATAKDWKQWVQPEELWFYNNAGFYIAGRVIEVVTGKTFEAVMTEKLLNPMGVPNTVLFTHDVIVRPHAVGHTLESREKGYTVAEPFAIPRHATAAGYVTAPVADLVKFAQMHLQDGEIDGTRILSPEAVKAMQEPQIEAGCFADQYGLGWAIEDFGGTKIIQHGGSTNGFQAHLDLVPGTGFAIATLTNGSVGTLVHDSIRKWALQKYRNAVRERPAPVSLKSADLKKRSGTWKRDNLDLEIAVDGDRLAATLTSYSPLTRKSSGEPRTYQLEPVSDDTYFVVDNEYDSDRWEFIDIAADRLGNERHLLRVHGRLVERVEAAKPAKKTATKKTAAKGGGKKKKA